MREGHPLKKSALFGDKGRQMDSHYDFDYSEN
jgi:hypothetical protein